jgi:hypothetical protein
MTAQNVPPLDFSQPFVDSRGFLTQWASWWLSNIYDRTGGTTDKVDAAHSLASNAAPATTQIVANGGLQVGGDLTDNVGVALYRAKCAVADLPATGNTEGDWAYALNGRKTGEGSGAGTGVPVWWSNGAWVAADSGATVAA